MYNQRAFKHGGYEDHLYDIWQDIKMRCSWPEHRLYHNNGARGVKVHDDWLNDYALFREYALTHGYKDGFHLHRYDRDSDYAPGNVFFSAMKPGSKYLEYQGEFKTQAEWSRDRGIKQQTLSKRLKNGWTTAEALEFIPRQ